MHIEGILGRFLIAACLQDQFVIEVETIVIDAVAGITLFRRHLKDVIAGARHGERGRHPEYGSTEASHAVWAG